MVLSYSSRSSYYFLAVLLVVLKDLKCIASTDPFIIQPMSVNTTVNSTVTFNCQAVATLLYYQVNGTYAGSSSITVRGFSQTNQETINSTVISRGLIVEATEDNNNTSIQCVSYPSNSQSTITLLRIQGLLAGVGNLTANQLNKSTLRLTWTPPYTLDNVPITGYYIDIINSTISSTNTIIPISDNTNSCTLTNTSISAINGAGTGVPTSVSFYYQTVPQVTVHVKLVPFLTGQDLTFQIIVNVSSLCTGQYPTNAVVHIKDSVNDNLQYNESLTFPVTDNIDESITINTTAISVYNLKTFTVNVSLSNKGGMFPTLSPFVFGFLGPVVNINSSIDNCSTINVTWSQPNLDKGVTVSHYILKIYDAVNNVLLNTLLINETTYQFEDKELFRHLYTYTVIPVNQLLEGESNNKTFSYQKVLRSTTFNSVSILGSYTDNTYIEFTIPLIPQCIGESPENVTVVINCGEDSGTNVLIRSYAVHDTGQLIPNITDAALIIGYVRQCNISIVFSNSAGKSEPLWIPLIISAPNTTILDSQDGIHTTLVLIGVPISIGIILLLTVVCISVLVYGVHKRTRNRTVTSISDAQGLAQSSTSSVLTMIPNETHDRMTTNSSTIWTETPNAAYGCSVAPSSSNTCTVTVGANAAYGEIRGNRTVKKINTNFTTNPSYQQTLDWTHCTNATHHATTIANGGSAGDNPYSYVSDYDIILVVPKS